MRMPRARFTIGRLMVGVLVIGLALWGVILPRIKPSIPEQQAQASYQQAKLTREVAELAVKEYEQGIYLQDLATIQGQVALAMSDQERAVDRLEWSKKMVFKGRLSEATNIADQLAKQQADFSLEQAQTQLKVLKEYTKEKQMKSLRSDVEKAKADELSKLQTYQMERDKRWGLFGF